MVRFPDVLVRQSPKSGKWFVRATDENGGVIFTDVYATEDAAVVAAGRYQSRKRLELEADELFASPDPDQT